MTKPAWIQTHALPPLTCPACGGAADAVTVARIGERPTGPILPQVGDAILCAYCSAVNIRTTVGLRVATDEECAELSDLMKQLAGDWKPHGRR